MFDPDLNPYVSRLEEHRDIVSLPPFEENQEFGDFVKSKKPLIIDLGCGAGNFLRDYALMKPEANFVGFELRFKRLVKGAIKFKKRGIDNVRLVQAKAEDIAVWIPDNNADEIHVNFPDPWPKKRHQKHRLVTSKFLKTLSLLLKNKGSFILKTDHKDYFHWAVDQIKQSPFFEISGYTEDLHNSEFNESNILTEFESLFKGKGFPVYFVKTNKVIQP